MGDNTTLPPLRILEAALHKTTEALVHELRCPTAYPPSWSDFEWRIAEAAATIHGIAALLSGTLRWRGPDRWQTFIAVQAHHTRLRRTKVAQMLERINAQTRNAGIPVVALKGAALYAMGLYPAGERPMGDIDLLVKPQDAAAAASLLLALGYEEGMATERHRVFESPERTQGGFGEHVDHPLKIELHAKIAEHLPISVTDITALEFPRPPRPGVNPYPSVAALMRHLLLHASCNIRARALRAIQLHDIALLAARLAASDWEELRVAGAGASELWWAFAPMMLTERYYPGTIPPAIIDAANAGCPRLLRSAAARHTLADVSWSNLRVRAFPGIEWSRSLPEALTFMRSRIFPARKDLNLLRLMSGRRVYARATPWYGLSHFNRIVRWVFSHPPRVQTIYPIKVVLGIRTP